MVSGMVMGMIPAAPVELSVMPEMLPVDVLVTVTSEPEASRSSCPLKLVHRSSNFTDCQQQRRVGVESAHVRGRWNGFGLAQ